MKKYYFVGICGIGMSALAKILKLENNIIYGSDRYFDNNENIHIKNKLLKLGIKIVPQTVDIIKNIQFDSIIVSTAINPDNKALKEARKKKIPVIHRSELLNNIISGYKHSIAVCGTSGKSSITAILGHIFQTAGYKPAIINGAYMKNFNTILNNSICGGNEYVIFESDESDGSFLKYKPETALISNISIDHKPLDILTDLFIKFTKNVKKNLILNIDCPEIKKLTFSNNKIYNVTINDNNFKNIKLNKLSISFDYKGNKCFFKFPGQYNLYNILLSIKTAELYGIKQNIIVKALKSYKGIVRRFDIKLKTKDFVVLDDYAHNPDKISNLINSLQGIRKNTYYIFQPHGYGPTALMFDEYVNSFTSINKKNDKLFLLPVYYAGGKVNIIKNSYDIYISLKDKGFKNVYYYKSKKTLLNTILKIIKVDTLIAVFGARDNSLNDFAKRIAEAIPYISQI